MEWLEAWAPQTWAASWDRVGLQVGHTRDGVDAVLVSLDLGPGVVEKAHAYPGRVAAVVHHPLVWDPLPDLCWSRPGMGLLHQVVKLEMAVVAVHTNLDVAPGGTEDALAREVGLDHTSWEVLEPLPEQGWHKLVVFVPPDYQEQVWQALSRAGAGVGTRYDKVGFRVEGTASFRPGAGSQPFWGKEGREERVRETRLETVIAPERTAAAIRAILDSHPYEEPAYEIAPLIEPRSGLGMGRLGGLRQPQSLGQLLAPWSDSRQAGSPTILGPLKTEDRVERVATAAGSGSVSLGWQALAGGAQILVTGEMKYPQALQLAQAGLTVVQLGHAASEEPVLSVAVSKIRELGANQAGVLVEAVPWAHAFSGLGGAERPRL